MPYINLIQEQRLGARTNERKARAFFMAMVGIVGAAVLGYGFLTIETAAVSGQMAELQAQNQKNAPMERDIADTKRSIDELTPRLKTLSDAQMITDHWNHILDHLTVQTPQDVWLTSVKCIGTDPAKPITITFEGLAAAQAPIGEFMMRLQNEIDLENVTFKGSNAKLVDTSTSIQFDIDADLVGSAQEKPKVENSEDKK